MICRARGAGLTRRKIEGKGQRSGDSVQWTMSRNQGTEQDSGRTACRTLIIGNREGIADGGAAVKDKAETEFLSEANPS